MTRPNFLQGVNGENSSKRLAGIATIFVVLILSLIGGYVFLKHESNADFLSLIETLSVFAASMLISGLAETLMNKKHGRN